MTASVLVVGDLMLDRYLLGRCDRISPEAPVQVVDIDSSTETLGGAGNVVKNLVSLGVEVRLATVIGGGNLVATTERLLADQGVDTSGLIVDPERRLTEKTRIIAAQSQIARFDIETRLPLSTQFEQDLIQRATTLMKGAAVVILSDYDKGVLTTRVCNALIARGRDLGIPTLCDPKGRDYSKYRGATLIKPNKREASEATGVSISDGPSLRAAGQQLKTTLDLDYVLITRGEQGMTLFTADNVHDFRAHSREVFDVTGAGDTVIAAIGAGLARGDRIYEACELANRAAGIVVGKLGAATVTLEELARDASNDRRSSDAKIIERADLCAYASTLRKSGRKLVFTNGCFDILHAGHVRYLEAAAQLGDVLVVAVNSDASVRRLKGPSRPVASERDRAFLLAALRCVDHVVVFDEDTPASLIRAILPDILVKGGDYVIDEIVGADVVQAAGGQVVTIPLVPGQSTTNTINRIRGGGD